RIGKRADRDARDDLRSAGIEHPSEAAAGADAPNFRARGMFAHVGNVAVDRNVSHGCEFYQIDDGNRVVAGADVSVETQSRAEKRWPVLAGKDDDGSDQQGADSEDDAKFRRAIHQFTMRWRTLAI